MRSCGPLPRILILLFAIVVFAFPLSGSQAATSTETKTTATVDYFFHGVPEDQLNKLASFANFQPPPAGSLTFNQSNIFDATPVAQSASCSNSEFIPNALASWWTGPFSGTINGTLTLDWWWQISNPAGIALGIVMNIKVVADPDFANPGVGTQNVIGNVTTTYTFADLTPHRFVTQVPVNGAVTGQLLIQAASVVQIVCAVELGLAPLYDNAATASKFTVPAPTAATLLSFTGKARGRTGVELNWHTASEVDALGYNVWRFGSAGKPVKVNRTILAAKGAGTGGAQYRLIDSRVRPGAYVYRLQVVRLDGTRAWRASTTVRVQ